MVWLVAGASFDERSDDVLSDSIHHSRRGVWQHPPNPTPSLCIGVRACRMTRRPDDVTAAEQRLPRLCGDRCLIAAWRGRDSVLQRAACINKIIWGLAFSCACCSPQCEALHFRDEEMESGNTHILVCCVVFHLASQVASQLARSQMTCIVSPVMHACITNP